MVVLPADRRAVPRVDLGEFPVPVYAKLRSAVRHRKSCQEHAVVQRSDVVVSQVQEQVAVAGQDLMIPVAMVLVSEELVFVEVAVVP